ncbi:MAG: hypothetical protein ACOYY3_16645 [Chloroflexota bacterium]
MFTPRSTKIGGLLLLVALMTACSLFAPGSNAAPTPDFSTPLPQFPTSTPVPPTAAATFTPLPLPAKTATPTNPSWPDLVAYDSDAGAYRLSFQPGWTWMQITDNTTTGHTTADGGKRFVLSAMKGQVMSISILQSWPFSLSVSDADGLLNDPQVEHPFWMGTLPVNGDYFITVKSQSGGDFTLRVAINPPGKARQYFDYSNSQFSLRYSDEFAPTEYVPVGEYKGTSAFALNFVNSDFYGPATNLSEAYFMVNTVADASTCTQVSAPNETLLGQETFNGYDFTQSQAIGAAAGNLYDQLFYRAVIEGDCYEIAFFMHSGNIGNYTPGSVDEFDRAALVQKFEEVLSTFTVK